MGRLPRSDDAIARRRISAADKCATFTEPSLTMARKVCLCRDAPCHDTLKASNMSVLAGNSGFDRFRRRVEPATGQPAATVLLVWLTAASLFTLTALPTQTQKPHSAAAALG